MQDLLRLHDRAFARLETLADPLLPLLARFAFAAALLGYFWASATTKLGDGFLGFLLPSSGAYAQIFPRQFEAAGYDVSQLGAFHWLVVTAGTWAEFLLPLCIVIGLFTRLAALGMTGFVAVQSLTDLYGHRAIDDPQTLGAWFDRMPDALILDQRLLWTVLLAIVVIKGAGALSLDRLLARRAMAQAG